MQQSNFQLIPVTVVAIPTPPMMPPPMPLMTVAPNQQVGFTPADQARSTASSMSWSSHSHSSPGVIAPPMNMLPQKIPMQMPPPPMYQGQSQSLSIVQLQPSYNPPHLQPYRFSKFSGPPQIQQKAPGNKHMSKKPKQKNKVKTHDPTKNLKVTNAIKSEFFEAYTRDLNNVMHLPRDKVVAADAHKIPKVHAKCTSRKYLFVCTSEHKDDAEMAACPGVHFGPTVMTDYPLHDVHFDIAWRALEDVQQYYITFDDATSPTETEDGLIKVTRPNEDKATEQLRVSHCLKTRGLTGRVPSLCAHYLRTRCCHLGSDCLFVHPIRVCEEGDDDFTVENLLGGMCNKDAAGSHYAISKHTVTK